MTRHSPHSSWLQRVAISGKSLDGETRESKRRLHADGLANASMVRVLVTRERLVPTDDPA
jgi:hypothetical protein